MREAAHPSRGADAIKEITASIRSDSLGRWHAVLHELPVLVKVLGLPNQLRLVIDANIVIAEVRWMVKRRSKQDARTVLQEVVTSGTVIVYAPPLLRVEVEKRLRTIAEDEGLPLQELMAAWASYEPLLRFVDPPSLRDAARRAAARDPNDAAYFELPVGVDAAAVYTEDPDLRAMGAPVVDRHTVRAARTYARAALRDTEAPRSDRGFGSLSEQAVIEVVHDGGSTRCCARRRLANYPNRRTNSGWVAT